MAAKKGKNATVKSTVKSRSVNVVGAGTKKKKGGAPFNEQDPKRRLGNFEGAGEASRKGGRTSGIVGQTTKSFRTETKKTKSNRTK